MQGMPVQAAMMPALKPSRSTPAIPEEGPAPSIVDFPRSSLDAARMMPTLLEQLQVSAARCCPPPLTLRLPCVREPQCRCYLLPQC